MSAPTHESALRPEKVRSVSILRCDGVGEPLVLLHGIGSNAASFAPLLQASKFEFAAIAWNAPGYGDSAPLRQISPTPGDYAQSLASMLDELGLARVALVGHSLGSLFAGCFAALYPERVSKLALLSPALGYKVVPGGPLPANVQARIDDLKRLGPAAFAARAAPRLVARPEAKPDLVARIEAAMSAVHPDGYGQAVRALGAGDLVGDAQQIRAPTLIAVGDQDSVTPPENARRLHQALKRPGPFALVPDCGHALPQDAPEAAAQLLSTFMRTSANV